MENINTDTETNAELNELQSTLDHYKSKVEKLNKENQSLRSVRNDSLRKSKALDTIIKAHNIDVDINKLGLEKLAIENNEVIGEFEYTPPPLARSESRAPVQNNVGNSLTLEDLKTMDIESINQRWDEVTTILKENK